MRRKYLWEKIYAALAEIEKKMKSQDSSSSEKDLEYKKSTFLMEIFEVLRFFGNSTEYSKRKYEIWSNRNKSHKVSAEILGIEVGSVKTTIWDYDGRLRKLIGIHKEDEDTVDTIDRVINCSTTNELEVIESDFWIRIKTTKGNYFRK